MRTGQSDGEGRFFHNHGFFGCVKFETFLTNYSYLMNARGLSSILLTFWSSLQFV